MSAFAATRWSKQRRRHPPCHPDSSSRPSRGHVTAGVEIADPIYQAIAHHVVACRLADAAREDCDRNLIDGRPYGEQATIADAAHAAFIAELKAARALDGAATTVEG
jgi:hypothetical protein